MRSKVRGWFRPVSASFKEALPAVVGFAVVRLLCLIPAWLWAQSAHKDFVGLLTSQDGQLYIQIAREGYGEDVTMLALFPLFPSLIVACHALLPVSFEIAALVVAWLTSLAAAWGLYFIGNYLYGRRTGIVLPLVWAALPNATVESMAYTENLFTALCAWTLYCVLERRWLLAAALSLIAGLSRPTASSLVAVVGVAAVVAIVQRRDGFRPWLTAALAPVGWVGYLGWAAHRTGRIDGFFHAQAQWGSSIDGGAYFVHFYWNVLARQGVLHYTFVALMLLLALCLFVLGLIDRQPWQFSLFCALILASIFVTAGFFQSKARFLLPAFPLLLPVARGLAQTTWPRILVVIAGMAATCAAYACYLFFLWGSSF